MKLFGHVMKEKDWVVVGGAAAAVAAAATLAQLHGSGAPSSASGGISAFPGDVGIGGGGGGAGQSNVGGGEIFNGNAPSPFTPAPSADPLPTPSQQPSPVAAAAPAPATTVTTPSGASFPVGTTAPATSPFDPTEFFPDHAPAFTMPQIFTPPALAIAGPIQNGDAIDRNRSYAPKLPDTSTLPGDFYTGPSTSQYLISGPTQSPDAISRNAGASIGGGLHNLS